MTKGEELAALIGGEVLKTVGATMFGQHRGVLSFQIGSTRGNRKLDITEHGGVYQVKVYKWDRAGQNQVLTATHTATTGDALSALVSQIYNNN